MSDDPASPGDVDAHTAARDRARTVRLAEALEPLRARLRAMGIDPDVPVDWEAVNAEAVAEWWAERDVIRLSAWSACVPPEFADARLADVDSAAFGVLDEWIAAPNPSRSGAPRRNVVLVGAVGVGKTHAAYALGHALVETGAWCTAVTTVDYLTASKPGGDGHIVNRAADAPYLILDDLGTEPLTDWAIAQVVGLLDVRYREHRPTIVTTNATYTSLAMSLGDRIMSRLTGGAVIVTLDGPDRRATRW